MRLIFYQMLDYSLHCGGGGMNQRSFLLQDKVCVVLRFTSSLDLFLCLKLINKIVCGGGLKPILVFRLAQAKQKFLVITMK